MKPSTETKKKPVREQFRQPAWAQQQKPARQTKPLEQRRVMRPNL